MAITTTPMHERVTNFANDPTRRGKVGPDLVAALEKLMAMLTEANDDVDDFKINLEAYLESEDKEEREEAEQTMASSNLAKTLGELGMWLDGIDID